MKHVIAATLCLLLTVPCAAALCTLGECIEGANDAATDAVQTGGEGLADTLVTYHDVTTGGIEGGAAALRCTLESDPFCAYFGAVDASFAALATATEFLLRMASHLVDAGFHALDQIVALLLG